MPSRHPKQRIRNDFTLGRGAAEHDGQFLDAFYETWLYRAILSKEDERCFIIGRTGSGKSALFRQLEIDQREHLIRLIPEDLALTYITETQAIQFLKALNVHLDSLFIALWKHVLIIEIIKHRYRVDSLDAKQRFMALLMEKIKRDRSKQEALKYLEEFEGKFWQETDKRVTEIIEKFESQVKAEAGGKLAAGIGALSLNGGDSSTESTERRSELVNRFQRLINETQIPRLNKMERVLNEDILDNVQHYTYIVIDDLDRDWADQEVINDLIRCLFRAVSDLNRVANLKIIVALRTNIFEALDFGRTGGQEEKFRDVSHHIKWTKHELRELLDNRAVLAAGRHGLGNISSVADLLPRMNDKRKDPLDYVLNRTLLRPRDAIIFLNKCFERANGKEKLTWNGIKTAESEYSKDRLLALRDEWKPTFPGIDQVFKKFSGSPHTLDWKEMEARLVECALLIADQEYIGRAWLESISEPMYLASSSDDPTIACQGLVRLLHNLGFIGCIVSNPDTYDPTVMVDDPAIYNYDDPSFPDHISNLRSVTGFTVHPAFRPALDIRDAEVYR
ncbi:hypothetical protein KBX71_15055 [Micromonospora sp. D93]|uniref:P-loop ATPase, Sll1717 family n=1 Tax=Micromonospora sp. D93 TaxID=2824886 RepID=UPI001B35D323|nr:hypothetical protein [Micromonospora sp. D93]MBQ1019174.1 hypothetical protein [Micromonospora sp. D93]